MVYNTNMRLLLRHIISLLLCVLPLLAYAQMDIQLSQYWAAPAYFNAGAVGQGDRLNILVGTRQQWVGIEGAPAGYWGRVDMPFKLLGGNHGVGLAFSSNSEGLFSNMVFGAQYAYKYKIKKSYLCIGAQLGLVNQKFDGTKVEIPTSDHHTPAGEDEDIPTTEVEGMAFDMALGIYYVHPYFHVGISATHLTEPTIRYEDSSGSGKNEDGFEVFVPRQFYFIAGGNIPLKNPLYEIQPSVMVSTDLNVFTAEATVRLRYNKFFWGGLGYRWNDAVSIMIGGEFKGFILGYSYDLPVSAVLKASSGSHEVFVGYSMKLDLSDKNKTKHKSIRIL